jgi:hypothetical protein
MIVTFSTFLGMIPTPGASKTAFKKSLACAGFLNNLGPPGGTH